MQMMGDGLWSVSTVAHHPPSSAYDLHLSVPLPHFSEAHFGTGLHQQLHHPQHVQQTPTIFYTSGGSETASTSTDSGKPRSLCVICGDGASGKHYGVQSCEGCKGFFKRTVRKDLSYTCRHQGCCVIDKRQRNRCQHCRYQKCAEMGMKRDAVQEERQSDKSKPILSIPRGTRPSLDRPDHRTSPLTDFHLSRLRSWALGIPAFVALPTKEQATMLHCGWTELILLEMVYRSNADRIWLKDDQSMGRNEAMKGGYSDVFDSLRLLCSKFHSLQVDPMEYGALRLIVLFNPDFASLESPHEMEIHRERVTASLVEHCRSSYPNDSSRSTRLLLRLPSLRYLSTRFRNQSIIVPPPPSLSDLAYTLSLIPPTLLAPPLPYPHHTTTSQSIVYY